MHIKSLFSFFILLLSSLVIRADPGLLDHTTRDWSEVSLAAASTGLPIAILVTSEDCPYCDLLKREVLLPMLRTGGLTRQLVLRELPLHTGGKLVDFDGEKVRARIFLRRYGVFVTPTLLFLNARGEALHKPLVGYKGADTYQTRLNRLLTLIADSRLGSTSD